MTAGFYLAIHDCELTIINVDTWSHKDENNVDPNHCIITHPHYEGFFTSTKDFTVLHKIDLQQLKDSYENQTTSST